MEHIIGKTITNSYWIQHTHLNGYSILFGGNLLSFIDETALILCRLCLGSERNIYTRAVKDLEFFKPVAYNSILQVKITVLKTGRSSITMEAECSVDGETTAKGTIVNVVV